MPPFFNSGMCWWDVKPYSIIITQSINSGMTTQAELPENNEASAEHTTTNGGTFTSSSARPSSQSRYSTSNFYKRI